jgi:hypothetical protein
MWKVYLVMFVVSAVISWLWVRGIDKQIQYKKENPDTKEGDGWLDWDNAHTENEL